MRKINIKHLIISCLLFLTVILTGCGNKKELKTISYDELAAKFKNNESFILYLGSSQCSHCADFRPTLEQVVSDYNLDVFYIDLAKISESQYSELSKKTDLGGTPTVLEVKDGEALYTKRIVGTKDLEATIDYFKSIEAIK